MRNVLVVEREASAAEAMVRDLRRQGYSAHSVDTGARALRAHHDAGLVLLSLDLPDIDGPELCRSLRAESNVPLIAFTHTDSELERILALKAGADDCVATTWGHRELGARIEAVLRRVRPKPPTPETISLRPLHIDPRTREVRLRDRVVNVTSKEFELLYALAADPGTVVSRKELMARVWGSSWVQTSRTIDTHVSSLRAKLGSSRWIITVRGVGYRMGHAWQMPETSAG
ncbi:response regulator transcription factor [Streptomyces radiopugnans]|uniref:DNA-binding response regulator, OmpR family, contains REC and winged-helix (WHTH) domain n=1 Tax=Streptomyces radiopugnans TaxID=403935 RepID=A0A1H9DZC7_9ACTN|nr:response regulator transcription factor [Streptomyces radiopugnans]SEQ18785.1 DNA-binding response regulator, OmpR family, contains REC and winged-helix (wHTH) domain [Streptomyces radiopugnans]